jgi:two-component system sensor histidine kinase RegB
LTGSGAAAAEERAKLSLDELVRLRWATAAGQAVAIAMAQATLTGLPLLRLSGLVSTLALSNVLLAAWRDRWSSPRALCGAALSLDTLLLTGLLHATGGAYNPFSVLYLVQITLAAVVLGARWTWFLAGLSVGCYGLLFATHLEIEHLGHGGSELSLHLRGMWVAFVVAAALTAHAVVKLCAALERRDAEMAEMRERVARQQRLASVTTLAAGAAHELGSPLATIAVASTELERAIRDLPGPAAAALATDAALIRSELERCRSILNRLASDAGAAPGEAPVELQVAEVVEQIAQALPPARRARLRARPSGGSVRVARGALLQVAQNLLQNAFEAGDGPVALSLEGDGAQLRLRVQDEGSGMDPEVLARAGEPFFSTRGAGRGLGLGIFIARTLSEQMGGALRLESSPGRGTTATVEVPVRDVG